VLDLYRAVGIICLVWVAISYILKQGVVICRSYSIGGDHVGVVFGGIGLCTDSTYRLWDLVR
jgi:hypothetical protein